MTRGRPLQDRPLQVERDPKTRFADRVANYVKYRPGYPAELLPFLARETGLQPEWAVADIGSGTGIFTELLLQNGHTVYAVEPNAEMRAAAEAQLGEQTNFRSIAGSAEQTTLPDACVELITCAQAFHWVEPHAAGHEFRRILRPDGYVVVIWNERLVDATPFLRDYEALLLAHATDYQAVNHVLVGDAKLEQAFGAGIFRRQRFANQQVFDWAGLRGRVLSSSYVPNAGEAGHATFMRELRRIFDRYAEGGTVVIAYDTTVYFEQPA